MPPCWPWALGGDVPCGHPHGPGPWTSTGTGHGINMCDDSGYDTLGHVCFPPSPLHSVGEQSEHPRNATSAASEHPQVPGASDFRDFVLEMQKTITDLRKQVPAAGPGAAFAHLPARLKTDSLSVLRVWTRLPLLTRSRVCWLLSMAALGRDTRSSLSFPVIGTLGHSCRVGGRRARDAGPEGLRMRALKGARSSGPPEATSSGVTAEP